MNSIRRYRDNLQDEIDGAALYTALSGYERDPTRKDLFLQLAQAENEHADIWRDKLMAAGMTDLPLGPSLKTRLLIRLARHFGPRFVLPVVAANEFADRNKYANQPDAAALSAEEHGHAAVIRAAAGQGGPVDGSDIAGAEHWHRGGSGNELRAAVLGVNDGLVSNFCLVMGVAGAGAASATVLLTGLAGLVAGALSMALGEWLSVTNARELARTQIEREAEELEQTPEARILRLRDAIHPDEVDTPVKRVCYIAQLAVAGEARAEDAARQLGTGIAQLRDALSGLGDVGPLDEAAEALEAGNFYAAMRALRRLLPVEAALLGKVEGTSGPRSLRETPG